MTHSFSNLILSWYQLNRRDLPWRTTKDAYKIWLSEIILQQTRVAQGLPYYLKFVDQYPKVQDLAVAPEDEVMRLWQGLGYYSRARNLHECAKSVVEDYSGNFPSSYDELLKLKGVGKYTAAAIASFAFDEVVPVVDGNVFRVLSRFFDINDDIAQPKTFSKFFELAREIMSPEQPSSFNQAIMELGALVCKPKKPLCVTCPLVQECIANLEGKQDSLPVKKKKLKVRKRFLYYLIREKSDMLAMKKRGANDIWQGLFDFEALETEKPMNEEELVDRLHEKHATLEILEISEPVTHILSHQRLEAVFIRLKEAGTKALIYDDLHYYTRKEIEELPKPRLIENYLTRNFF